MPIQVDDRSRIVLQRCRDGVILGVLARDRAMVRLFPTRDHAQLFASTFDSHAELFPHEIADPERWLGFSICLREGVAQWCSTISTLNLDPAHTLNNSEMLALLSELELPRSADFRIYADAG